MLRGSFDSVVRGSVRLLQELYGCRFSIGRVMSDDHVFKVSVAFLAPAPNVAFLAPAPNVAFFAPAPNVAFLAPAPHVHDFDC